MDSSADTQHKDPDKQFGLALFYFLVCAFMAFAATALRLLLLNKGMGAGEALAYHIATQPGVAEVEAEARTFAQQPFYYLLAYHWMRMFGQSLANLRMFSAAWGAAWLMLLYPAGAWATGRRAGGYLAMAAAMASPFAAYISLTTGPDAMLAALTLLCCIPFLEFTRDKTPLWAWPAWAAATVLILLTHPYAIAIPVFQAVYMMLRRGDKSLWFRRMWFGLLAVCLLIFLALRGSMPPEAQRQVAFLLPESMKQLQLLLVLAGLGIVNGGPPAPVLTMDNFTALTVFSALGVGAAALWTLRLRREHPRRVYVLCLFAAAPVAVLFFACTSFHGVVLWPHFAFISSAAYLMYAFVLMRGRSRTGRAGLAALVLIVNIAGFQACVRSPHMSYDWQGAFKHIVKYDSVLTTDSPTMHKVGNLLSLAPPDHRPLTDYYSRRPSYIMSVTAARLSPLNGQFETAPEVLVAEAAHTQDCFWIAVKMDALEKELPHAWRARFFTPHHARTFRSVFTEPDLYVEQLCATRDTRSLRAMSREHFVEYLLGQPEPPNFLEGRYARSNFFFEKGYLDLAESEMLSIRKEFGDLRGIDLNLCFISLAKGKEDRNLQRLEQAMDLCRSAQKNDPGNAYIDYLIGEILFHLARFEDCRAPLKAVLDDKNYCTDNSGVCMRASYFSGAALYRLGKKEAALPLLQYAIPSTDIGPKASYLLGVAYYELGYPQDALPHLKRVIGVQILGDQAVQLVDRIQTENPELFEGNKAGKFMK
jgi:tetratricopeptide (TPR) repeat protein